ncbi:hypothetical protein AAFF_G00245390 [Aldrovandia affinis]|uniref:Uncharacterized protein n=1 Tax=Aldrovandia affinis TaxID=143900 RepID=A0AAD7RDR6_9TELE|nr:hypothetical protein AAFF_G00245390 [Aldrovandia affinis]
MVLAKIRETFAYRQSVIHNQQQTSDIHSVFLRFLDTKGLILQDFALLFGTETASKFLKKWGSTFKERVIREAKTLPETPLLLNTLKDALKQGDSEEPGWDSDVASVLLLLHLLTPQPAGRKRAKKISVREAVGHLVKFQKEKKSESAKIGIGKSD